MTNFRAEDKVRFSTVTAYTKINGLLDLTELSEPPTTLAGALNYAAGIVGAGAAAGFIYNGDGYLLVNAVGASYAASDDAVVKLVGLVGTSDALNALTSSSFIA